MLERRLGGGGMAEVFLAHSVGAEGFTRQVAIKRVLAGFSDNPQFAQMFVEEGQLCARLQHSNIVSVLDFDRGDDGRLFLVMELVDGVDLDALIASGPLPIPAIVFITAEILRGLGYAHDLPVGGDGVRGVIHRDVSPHNVLLSWQGAVKLSDFGIAKTRAATAATGSQLIKGKLAYMSPEQANGEALDGRSDLFAVGVMLWEMLCGRPLFGGATMQETLARLMFAPIPWPHELRPDAPDDVERIVQRLLARERAERYPDAESVIADLIACRDQPRSGCELLAALLAERFTDRAPRRARSAVHSGPIEPAPAIATAEVDRPRRGRRGWLALGGTLAAVAVGAGIAAAWPAGLDEQPPHEPAIKMRVPAATALQPLAPLPGPPAEGSAHRATAPAGPPDSLGDREELVSARPDTRPIIPSVRSRNTAKPGPPKGGSLHRRNESGSDEPGIQEIKLGD